MTENQRIAAVALLICDLVVLALLAARTIRAEFPRDKIRVITERYASEEDIFKPGDWPWCLMEEEE